MPCFPLALSSSSRVYLGDMPLFPQKQQEGMKRFKCPGILNTLMDVRPGYTTGDISNTWYNLESCGLLN